MTENHISSMQANNHVTLMRLGFTSWRDHDNSEDIVSILEHLYARVVFNALAPHLIEALKNEIYLI